MSAVLAPQESLIDKYEILDQAILRIPGRDEPLNLVTEALVAARTWLADEASVVLLIPEILLHDAPGLASLIDAASERFAEEGAPPVVLLSDDGHDGEVLS